MRPVLSCGAGSKGRLGGGQPSATSLRCDLMNRRRLVLSAALVLAPFAPTLSSAQPPATEPRAIAADVIEKLLKLIAAQGVDTELPASIAGALALGVAGKAWPDR